MKRDYYEILDVSRAADELALKSAYRKLAVQYHPDRNPGSREAEEKFKEVTEAYQVLIDPVQRSAYDGRTARRPIAFRGAPWPRFRVMPIAIAIGTASFALASVLALGKLLSTNISRHQLDRPLAPASPPPVAESKPAPQNNPRKRTTGPSGVVTIVRGARPVTLTPLDYSPDALREGVSGLVELQFTIAENGSVQRPVVLSGHPLLTPGLPEKVSQWTFQPMRVNGRPSPMTTEMTLRFQVAR